MARHQGLRVYHSSFYHRNRGGYSGVVIRFLEDFVIGYRIKIGIPHVST